MNKKIPAFIILLAVIIFGLYFNIIYNMPTNWDDPGLINNPDNYALTSANLKRIFTINSAGTYQPARDFSYVIDYAVSPHKPFLAIHVHSMVLYFFMILAAWLFLLELFKAFSIVGRKAYFWASVSALIYAVHPVHVESVVWLYARKEPLLGLFTMLSLWAFVKARISSSPASLPTDAGGNSSFPKGKGRSEKGLQGWVYSLLSFGFLLLAILSKPTAFIIPVFMVVLDICLQLHHPQKGYWFRKGLFFLAAFIIVLPLSVWLVRMMTDVGGIKPYHGGTFWNNLLAVSQIFIEYISLYATTVYFSADYPIKLFTSISLWQAWVYFALNLLLTGFALYSAIKRRYLTTIFIALHYIFILPVSHIFPINNNLADRYALLPSLSWCVLLGWIITALWYKRLTASRFSENFPQLIAMALLFLILASYSYMTYRQTFVWKNSVTLWEHTLRKYPNSNSANVNMAAILIDVGQYEAAKQLCYMAILEKPYDYIAISNMALAQMGLKDYKNAIHNFNVALYLNPDLINARIGLASCYLKTGEANQAYKFFRKITDSGDYRKAGFSGLLYSRQALAAWKIGKKDEAINFLKMADISRINSPMVLQEIALNASSMGANTLVLSAYKQFLTVLKKPEEIADVKARIAALEAKTPKR